MLLPIKDFPGYSITDDGQVRSDITNRFLLPGLNSHGYPHVTLCRNGERHTKKIHRLLLLCQITGNHLISKVLSISLTLCEF
jgi:hypothetical protein